MRTIFCIILSLFYGVSSKTIHVASNGILTLQPLVKGEIADILWKHNGNKMVEWDKKAGNIREYLKFKGRIKLDVKTGDATILNLTKDDSGFYDADIIIQGRITSIKHRVEVVDPVTKAKVTCLSNATLHCEAEGDSLDYSWSGPGLQTAEMRGQTGPQISKENQDSVYTCVVNNTVSNSSVTYHASDCFTSDAGDHQLILGVVFAVIGVIGVAGLGYYYYKINSTGQKHTGNENKRDTTGKIITNQKKEDSVLLLPGSSAVTHNTCNQSLISVQDKPTGDLQGKVAQFEEIALVSPTTSNDPMNVPGLFKESDSAPMCDESFDPDHYADPLSGSPRQSGNADHTFSDDRKSPLCRSMEGTCENERGMNTGTWEQNQSTINKSPSGSAGNASTDITDTLSCERMEESVNVGDNSSGKPIITGSQATHTAATHTCDRSSDTKVVPPAGLLYYSRM